MRIGMIASYPANALLEDYDVRQKNRINAHPRSWVRSLCTTLSQNPEIDVRVFALGRDVLRRKVIKCGNFEVEYIPQKTPARFDWMTRYYLKTMQIKYYVQRYHPDLVHGFGMETGNASIATRMDFPATAFIQGIVSKLCPFSTWSKIHKRIAIEEEKNAVQHLNGMVAETQFAYDWAKTVNPEANVRIIPHAVNREFSKSVCAEFRSNNFLFVGTLSRIKGVDLAIRALAELNKKEVGLRIAGSGAREHKSSLVALSKYLGVEKQITYLDQITRDNVVKEMSNSLALIVPSRMDTSPNVVTEAHAVGIPVIGTKAGGIPDMIDDGCNGLLVESDDYKGIAHSMARCLKDRRMCFNMGANGQKKVAKINDPQRIANEHVKFFKEILHL